MSFGMSDVFIEKNNKLTDNEIIKAFEVCFSVEDCKGCPLCGEEDCPSSFQLVCMVLDLINRQQAEISVKRKLLEKAEETINKQQAEIERLQLENEKLEIELKSKAEALNKSTNSAMEVIKKQEAEIERLKRFKSYFENMSEWCSDVVCWHLDGKFVPFKSFYEKALEEMEGKIDE